MMKTLIASIIASSAAGVFTEWSVSKSADQIVIKTEKQVCLPQISTIPYELREYFRIYHPEQNI